MKSVNKLEIRYSLSIHRVLEVWKDDVDLAERLPSLVSLLVGWLRTGISRLLWAKLRDVLNSFWA